MQQTLCSRGSGSFLLERNGQACGAIIDSATSCDLPFRCPRCGEQERFRSLASLRAHLEYRHSYRSPDVIAGDFSITGKHPDPLTAAIPWQDMSLPTRRGQQGTTRPPHVRSLSDSRDSGYLHSYTSVRRRTQSVGERQEVADRERSLSRQVDVAVMVIAALREQLNASENELERREREVITIQRFLEAAARQETSGKVRIQRFIENLLGRIALAEKLVEFYQVNGSPAQCEHYKVRQHNQELLGWGGNQNQADNGHHRISKSRTQSSSQFSGAPQFSKAGVDRERERQERLAQSSRLFCRPEHRDDIWNHQQRRSTGYEA
ncbi:hypothetical protein XENOCAPTIV_022576 [Xenoophorus captivus]|uniref:FBX41/ZN365 C2H2-type zinc finger domain-containing protein n=1 Tax=Xenoophorus captivus TaxID=1517983 RepID=A0ABV0SGL8_9TELE